MITVPRRHKHPSSGANRPSDVTVIVNINAEFNLMAVNPIIEFFSRDLVTGNCESIESSAVYTVPPSYAETVTGHSNKSLTRLPLHMNIAEIIRTCLISNIYVGLCLPKALTMT